MGVVATETELLRPAPPPSDAHPHRPQYSSGPVGYTTLCIYVAAHRLFGSVKKKNMSLMRTLFSIQSTIFWIFNVVVADVISVASSRLKNRNSPLPCTVREKVPTLQSKRHLSLL